MSTVTATWFEIPVTDLKRAKAFYEAILDCTISTMNFGGFDMGFFPGEGAEVGATGALMTHEDYIPSHKGTLIYLGVDDCQIPITKVAAAGGEVLREKTQISPEHGYMATFEDTEGNRIALHSRQ